LPEPKQLPSDEAVQRLTIENFNHPANHWGFLLQIFPVLPFF
jgi:hypothetical protein